MALNQSSQPVAKSCTRANTAIVISFALTALFLVVMLAARAGAAVMVDSAEPGALGGEEDVAIDDPVRLLATGQPRAHDC